MFNRMHKATLVIVTIMAALLLAVPAFAQTATIVELIGTINSVTDGALVINSQNVITTGAEITVELAVGTIVKVEGTLNADGSITARQVKAAGAGVQPGEVEIVGIADSISTTTLVVNGLSIDITTAQIYAGVSVGEMVKVHASVNAAGLWVAREVAFFVGGDDNGVDPSIPPVVGEFEITGTLDSVGDGSIVIAGQDISTIGAEIKGTLVAGLVAKAHVSLVNGVLVAREVELVNPDDNSSDDDNSDDNSSDDDNSDDNSSDDDNSPGNVITTITLQNAIEQVLAIYPNTSVLSIELESEDGGYVWKIRTSHGHRIQMNAETGVILTIEDGGNNGDDSSSGSSGSGSSVDDNSGSGSSDDQNDDHGGDRDDNDDDNSGSGSSNDDDDDDSSDDS